MDSCVLNGYRDLEDPFDEQGWDDLKSDWPLEWVSDAEMTPHSRDELQAIMQAENWFRHAKQKSKPFNQSIGAVISNSSDRRVAQEPH